MFRFLTRALSEGCFTITLGSHLKLAALTLLEGKNSFELSNQATHTNFNSLQHNIEGVYIPSLH